MTRRKNPSHVYHIQATKNFSIRFIFRIISIEQQERNRQAKISMIYKILVFVSVLIRLWSKWSLIIINKFDEIAIRVWNTHQISQNYQTYSSTNGTLRLISLGLLRSMVLFRRKTKIRNSGFLQASSGVTNERHEAPKDNENPSSRRNFILWKSPLKIKMLFPLPRIKIELRWMKREIFQI